MQDPDEIFGESHQGGKSHSSTHQHPQSWVRAFCLPQATSLFTEVCVKVSTKAVWSHFLVLGRQTGRVERRIEEGDPQATFTYQEGSSCHPSRIPGVPPSQAPLVWIQETQQWEKVGSFSKGRVLQEHIPSGSNSDVCLQQKFRFSCVAGIFAVHLLHAQPWAEPACS